MRCDAIFYQIFKRFPSLVFTLIDVPGVPLQDYRFESVEVKEPAFRIDGVFLPPAHIRPQIVCFGEIQCQKDETLYHRFFCEILLYLYRNHPRFDNWYGIIIFASRSLEPSNTDIHSPLLASNRVRRIYLDELALGPDTPLGLRLIQLTILPEHKWLPKLGILFCQYNNPHLTSCLQPR